MGPVAVQGGPIGSKRRNWGILLSILVLLGIAVVLLRWRRSGFDWQAFSATFRDLYWRWVAAAACLALLTYYGRALRWEVMLRPVSPHPNRWGLFTATAIGFTAVVIFGRAGELVRPYLISLKERVPFSSQLAAWLIERIYDLLMVLLVFGFALSQIHRSDMVVGPRIAWVLRVGGWSAALTSAICLTILFLFREFSQPVRGRLLEALAFLPPRLLERARRLLDAFLQGMEATRSGSSTLWLVLYTLLEWILIAGCYVCLFNAFQATRDLGLTDVLIFMGFVAFGSVVQIPGVGGGMQLVSVVVLTEVFGLRLEVAGSIAILVWGITFVVIVPVGILLALHEGITWSRLKSLEEESSR